MLISFKLQTELSITWFFLLLKWLKEFLNAVSGKHEFANNTHNFYDKSVNFEVMLNDCNETVCDDCNVYLYSDCVLRFSPKLFDSEMLLNPFEKYFDLTSVFIQESNILGCKIKIVCVVSELPLKILHIVNNSSNSDRVVLFVPISSEANSLVSQIHSIEPTMQFELFCDTFRLGNCHHIECKFLKDAMIPEKVSLRHLLSVDRLMAKTEMFRLPTMSCCNICQFSKCTTINELTKYKNQQMVPMRHRPTFGSVVVLGEYTPELSLWKKLVNLCKNELPYMHICFGLESNEKVGISKPGHGLEYVNLCA